jgi:hypothetical protein
MTTPPDDAPAMPYRAAAISLSVEVTLLSNYSRHSRQPSSLAIFLADVPPSSRLFDSYRLQLADIVERYQRHYFA